MAEGGKVSLPVVPDWSGFGSLFSGGIRGALNQAEGAGKEIGKLLGGGMQSAVALGAAGAAVAIGDFVLGSVRKYAELGKTTLELQHITGATAESASLFAGVLTHVGSNVETVNRGLLIFGAHVAAQPELFTKYGVAIAKTRDGNNDLLGTLDNVRKLFNSSADAGNKDAISKALLGRSALQLASYLNLSNEQVALFNRLTKQSGGVLSTADVNRTRELAINMQEAKDKVQALQVAIARPVVSGVNKAFEDVPRTLLALNDAAHLSFGGLVALATGHSKAGDAARRHAIDEVNAKAITDQMGVVAAATASTLSTLASAGEGVRSASSGLAKAQAGVASAARNTQHAIEGLASAHRGVAAAHQNAQHAAEAEAKAERTLNDLLQKGAVDAKAVEQAEDALASAKTGTRNANESLAAAEQHLADVRAGATTDDITIAKQQLRQADIALKEARLAQSQPGNPNDPYAGERAKLGVDQAVEQQKLARQNLTKVQEQGTSADKNLADAQKAVRDAGEAVAAANTVEGDAAQKLRDAQAGDPDFQQKVADAKDAVARAAEGVASAQQGEADAARSVRDAQQAIVDAKQGQVDAASAVEEATYKLRDAHYTLDDAFNNSTLNAVQLRGVLDTLKTKYPELAGIIQQFYADVDHAAVANNPFRGQSAKGTFDTGGSSSGILGPIVSGLRVAQGAFGVQNRTPSRGSGGDVVPGQMYRVNENTPNTEFVEFPAAGRVFTPSQAALAGGASEPTVIHNHIYIDGKEVATSTSRHMRTERKAYSR